ncbi:HupE/UreJ family protein [Sphingomonas sp. IW22]|uniref:HupE/UreJ family protein n=1 Tax=Sphingomonas sp. IW22 TaxID=3242489 RepID=UPI0035214FAE
MWRNRLSALLLALATLVPSHARADIFMSADFALSAGEDPGTYELTAAVPETLAHSDGITLPDGCRQTGMTRQSAAGRAHFAYTFACDRALGGRDVVQTPWKVDGGRFLSSVGGVAVDRSLAANAGGIAVPVGDTAGSTRPLFQLAREFVAQGVWHIWTGWDHLAFVLCLTLLARGRGLLWLVSAFTLGHSISLAVAFFDLVRVPIPPVEAAIALSIAFMAREAPLVARGVQRFASDRQLIVVSLFGLLHGLGFASALGELGVRPGERIAGLVFFNIGVELGQLVFVGAIVAMLAGLRAVRIEAPARVAALYAVGAVGCFWMVERLAGFAIA